MVCRARVGGLTMSTPLLIQLLMLSCVLLAGLGLSGLLVARQQAQYEKRAARLAAVAAPHAPAARGHVSAFTPPRPARRSLLESAMALFGIDLARADQYPMQWWAALGVTLAVAAGVCGIARGMVGNLALPVLPLGWMVLSRMFFGWAAGRRQDQLLKQFPDALAMIVRAVGVGIPVLEAMRAVSREAPEPSAPEFARLLEKISIGMSLQDALLDMARRTNLTEYRFFATTLSLQAQTGGALSATLDGLADVIRKRLALKERGHALSSEARMSATVLALLPLATGGLIFAMNPVYIGVLFTDPMGRSILGGAVVSLGMVTMRTIIRRTLS